MSFNTTEDIINEALFTGGEPQSADSDFRTRALAMANRGYKAIWSGGAEFDPDLSEDWWWLRSTTPGVLTLLPAVVAGTISVTNNSTSATLTNDPGDVSGWFLKVADSAAVYRISANTGTALTLDGVYTSTTNSAASYKLFKLEYTLDATVLKVISPMRKYGSSQNEINGMSLDQLHQFHPLQDVTHGDPQAFAVVSQTAAGVWTVRLSHYAGDGTDQTKIRRVEYDFHARPADLLDSASSIPLIPPEWRYVLSDITAFFLLQDKDDSQAPNLGVQARAGLQAMAKENRRRMAILTRDEGRIFPRQSDPLLRRGRVQTASGFAFRGI